MQSIRSLDKSFLFICLQFEILLSMLSKLGTKEDELRYATVPFAMCLSMQQEEEENPRPQENARNPLLYIRPA